MIYLLIIYSSVEWTLSRRSLLASSRHLLSTTSSIKCLWVPGQLSTTGSATWSFQESHWPVWRGLFGDCLSDAIVR